jgi:hypothetical protein
VNFLPPYLFTNRPVLRVLTVLGFLVWFAWCVVVAPGAKP